MFKLSQCNFPVKVPETFSFSNLIFHVLREDENHSSISLSIELDKRELNSKRLISVPKH